MMYFMMYFLGIAIVPKKLKTTLMQTFQRTNKVYYERCTIGDMRHLAAKHDSDRPL